MTDRIAEIKTRCEAARICSEKYLSGEWTTQTDARNYAEDVPYLLHLLSERDAEIERLREAQKQAVGILQQIDWVGSGAKGLIGDTIGTLLSATPEEGAEK